MNVPQFMPYIGMEEYEEIKSCFEDNWITEDLRLHDKI